MTEIATVPQIKAAILKYRPAYLPFVGMVLDASNSEISALAAELLKRSLAARLKPLPVRQRMPLLPKDGAQCVSVTGST